MPDQPTGAAAPGDAPDDVEAGSRPGLTACSLCAGETLAASEPPGTQLARLQACARRAGVPLTLVECLDQCERGDVVVARPSRAGRARGASPVWFERLAGDDATAALRGWLRSGGPGAAPVPAELRPLRIERSEQV